MYGIIIHWCEPDIPVLYQFCVRSLTTDQLPGPPSKQRLCEWSKCIRLCMLKYTFYYGQNTLEPLQRVLFQKLWVPSGCNLLYRCAAVKQKGSSVQEDLFCWCTQGKRRKLWKKNKEDKGGGCRLWEERGVKMAGKPEAVCEWPEMWERD